VIPLSLKPDANGCDSSEKNHRYIQGEDLGDLIWRHGVTIAADPLE
jgi:hypothetical protein